MVDFTFLELHLHDSSITANAPFSGQESPAELEGEDHESDEQSGGGFPIGAMFGLVLVVVAVVAARRYLSGDEIQLEDEIEV